nr:uncharacterized protein LOC100535525 [Danio rerio]|eukprot:XP_003197780.3 uncharacterized protein LOC100535525 [Danio rerio]
METLNSLSDLKESGFGRPPPRHGLNLLWWFAQECVRIDSNQQMTALCYPENGCFGFHRFYNRDRPKLLPPINLPYYEVGNLHNPGSLPYYVIENYTGYLDDSNCDRIIVSYNWRWKKFDSVYVTRHSDQKNFDPNCTRQISPELMKTIKEMRRAEFLSERRNQPESHYIEMPHSVQSETSDCPNRNCWIGVGCAIGVIFLIVMTIVLLFVFGKI